MLWPENLEKKPKRFFSNFVLLMWEQFTVANNTICSFSRVFDSY